MKNKANKGFIKELSKGSNSPKADKSLFTYSNPVVTPERIKSVSFKSKSREPKPSSNMVKEQKSNINKGK